MHYRFRYSGCLADLQEAVHSLREAIELTSSYSPDQFRRLDNFGDALLDLHRQSGRAEDLGLALSAYREGLSILDRELLLSPVLYQSGQYVEQVRFYSHACAAFQQADQPQEALAVIEASKFRFLRASMGRGKVPAPHAIPKSLLSQEQSAASELAALDTTDLDRQDVGPSHRDAARDLGGLRRRQALISQLTDIWEKMEAYGPEAEEYVDLRRGDSPGWGDLFLLAKDLGPDIALLSLSTIHKCPQLFVLRATKGFPTVVEDPHDLSFWLDALRRLYREVHRFDGSGRRGETWAHALQHFLTSTAPHIEETPWVVIAPDGPGHLLPWGALAQQAGWGACLVTVPALDLLRRIRLRSEKTANEILIVGNPTGDLIHAEEEAKQVADMLGVKPVVGKRATKELVLAKLPEVGVAHFATHAHFAPTSPLDSGIVLADGVLTARDILKQKKQAPDFVVLSGCETGMVDPTGGGPLAGLSHAFLYAGAKSLLVSLWRVNDPATAFLMVNFYNNWSMGQDKATALRGAMESTRRHCAMWSHTYYWGAFLLVGEWH